MKKNILFVLSALLLFASCKTTFTSNKLSGYDKKIEGDLTIYMAYVESTEKDKLFEGMKKDMIDKFAQRGVKADVIILKIENILNKEDIKTNNPNGLTLLIHESTITTYTSNYESSKATLILTDHTLGKDVWKSETALTYKGVLGGASKAGGTYSSAIIRTLEKDGLLKK